MSRLVIDVFPRPNTTEGSDPRDAGYVAIAVEPGKPLEQGGLGGGMTQRLATEAAVRSFYARPLVSEPLPDEETPYATQVDAWNVEQDNIAKRQRDAWDASRPAPGVSGARAVSQSDIKEMLTSAVANGTTLNMVYQDAGGARTERPILPLRFEQRRVGLGFEEDYVHATDLSKSQPRMFRLSRIERLDVA